MRSEIIHFPGFGETLKAARKQKRLTQKQLAQQLGVHYNTISSWELGTYLPETRGVVLELAHCLCLDEQKTRQLLEASLTALSPYWNVPYPRNPFFTGRKDILHQLHNALHYDHSLDASPSCALSGLGGIGKTQTTIEYAYRYANNYSAIFWVGAQTYESIITSFITIVDLLNLSKNRVQEHSQIVTTVINWLNSHNQWLLIFDNVEDIALVKRFLPAARHGSLFFTSRRQAFESIKQVLTLEPMTEKEGLHFLLHRARKLQAGSPSLASFSQQDIEIVQEIVMEMGGLPLALDQAGSYIEATHCSLSDYLQLYRASKLYLLDKRETHADHPHSAVRTITLAFEQLEQSHARAAELLIVCAFLAPDAIPETFFQKGAFHLGPTFEILAADPFAFYETTRALLTYSLLQRSADTHTLTIHRLVQVVLKARLSKVDQRIWILRVVSALCDLFPVDETIHINYWQNCNQLLPHALTCLALSEQCDIVDGIQHLTLKSRVATYLLECGRYIEAEQILSQALDLGKQVLDPKHPLVINLLNSLASLYLRQGKHADAESHFLYALTMQEQTLGTQQPPADTSFNGLGNLYMRQGKYAEAESHFLRALTIREQMLGPDHPQVATSLGGLAVLYGEQEKYEVAKALYERALTIRERALGPDHPQVATLLNNLAQDYKEQKKYEEAEVLFLRTLKIWQQDLGADHLRVAYPLNNLAELYLQQGKLKEAEPLFQRALNIWEQGLGVEHFLVADPLDGLALLYTKQGKYAQAEPLFQRALQVREQALGPQHPTVGDSLHHLASFYHVQQQTTEALSLYQQALAIRNLMLGPEHPKTKETHNAYIQLLHEHGDMEQSVE